MLKKILIGVAAVLAVLLVVVALQPSTYRVERSLKIAAPAAVVFPMVDDLRGFQEWSPWEKLDPGMKRTFLGPARGVGAVYSWAGNDQVGSGKMTVTESVPDSKVVYALQFIEPFASEATTTLTLAPAGAETQVTWAMEGTNGMMGKAFSLVMDMDKMIGADFEKGLDLMRHIAEKRPREVAPKP